MPANPLPIDRRKQVRREDDREAGFDRDDIFLLLESYRNTIELNTTLLERQEILNQKMEPIRAELVTVCKNQAAFSARLTDLSKEIENHINERTKHAAGQYDTIKKKLDQYRLDQTREHGGHTIRIHAAMAGMGGIIIALIGLLAKVWGN